MAKKKVCVSFDYEHDKNYYFLLKAWNNNHNIDFSINDCTPREIQSERISKIKQVLSKKIGEANYMIAIIGKYSYDEHPDSDEIGYINWQAYEIAKNIEKGNGLVVVKLSNEYCVPIDADDIGAEFVTGFEQSKILDALKKLSK